MKKNNQTNLLKGLVVLIALLCVSTLLFSCGGSDELDNNLPDEPNKTPELIDVSLGFVGDPISISESQLSRAGETKKKIYGINVYYREGEGGYNHYAYGLFDNVADMKISLISKFNYKFECTIVQDDKDELYIFNEGYSYPFRDSYSDNTKLENKFIVSTTSGTYLRYMKYGKSTVKDGTYSKNMDYPRTDRLYGELTNYIPTDGGTAVINMKRTVFGAKFVINPPADGTLEIRMSPIFSKTISSTDAAQTIEESIYTFYDVYDCWKQQDDYTQYFDMYLTWKRANGATQNFSKTITMKRNVMTTVNISVTGSTGESSIGFNEEKTAMGTATINASFNGGSSDDNNVNPQ